ncbi:hypothetical protein [Clostridium sp. ZS2-4]|uniref:hypothetical protein n=1 Tax=Clostridium sp. ZS2-4 TaxID=2987703 RepID=UPI00227AEB32|nr:hypothetical protein [Clostridium sp. ZS2-4]MCY6356214.1 hypothetical protein [Clostridium sp. ZS2-4]
MKYYLETNAIRHLSKYLGKLSNECIFTSYLTIFELLSGIVDNKSFIVRKNILKSVIDSKIEIDWSTLKERLHHAHKIDYFDKEKIIAQIMVDIVLESESYEQLDELSEKKGFQYRIESFQLLDQEISEAGINESKENIKSFKESNDKIQKKRIKEELIYDEKIYSYAQLNREIIQMNIIKDMTETSRILKRDLYLKILENYDESLDSYFYVSAYKHSISGILGQIYAKNDTVDIAHLVYVDENTTIVSDDKIFGNLSKDTKKFSALSIEEFKKEFKLN